MDSRYYNLSIWLAGYLPVWGPRRAHVVTCIFSNTVSCPVLQRACLDRIMPLQMTRSSLIKRWEPPVVGFNGMRDGIDLWALFILPRLALPPPTSVSSTKRILQRNELRPRQARVSQCSIQVRLCSSHGKLEATRPSAAA